MSHCSRYKAIISPFVLSQQCCKVYLISIPGAKPLWDLTTKNITEIAHPPLLLTLLAGSAPDLGAGVEQPFDCLVIQNHQDMHFMGRLMDWTVEDNTVNSLFFCATLTSRRRGHTPVCVRSGNIWHRCGGGWAGPTLFLAGSSQEGGCRCGSCYPTTPHSIGDPPGAPALLLLPDELTSCCAAGTNGRLDLRCRAFSLDGQVSALSRADAQAPWHGMLKTVWLYCNVAQQVGCLRG